MGIAPPQDCPRLTSDGGSQRDDAELNKDLPAGAKAGSGGAPIGSALRRALDTDQQRRLHELAKNHSREYCVQAEVAMLNGMSIADAEREASKITGE